jgi:hypothetical protein
MEKQNVRVTRGSLVTGTTDRDTGVFTPDAGTPADVWAGRGIYLDQGPMDRFNAQGVAEYEATGSVYLPKGVIESSGVQEGDTVTVTYRNGDTVDAEVAKVIRYKRRIDVRRA